MLSCSTYFKNANFWKQAWVGHSPPPFNKAWKEIIHEKKIHTKNSLFSKNAANGIVAIKKLKWTLKIHMDSCGLKGNKILKMKQYIWKLTLIFEKYR